MGRKLLALLCMLALVASACGSSDPEETSGGGVSHPASNPSSSGGPPTYVAIGASETVGVGAAHPRTEGWTSVLAERTLPAGADYMNLGISGATVAQALKLELPKAEAAEPDLVTVWLNANDILSGVSLERYSRNLTRLLDALAATDARILVANTPPLSELPAVLACQPDPPRNGLPCLVGDDWPPPNLLEELVDRFNHAISTIAKEHGAIVVDLYAAAGTLDETKLVAFDGFHPNTRGHRAVAMQFAKAMQRAGIEFD